MKTLVTLRRREGARIRAADALSHWWSLPQFPDPEYYRQPNGISDGVHPHVVPTPWTGHAGLYHLAEPIVPMIQIVPAAVVPSAPWASAALSLALCLTGLRAAARSASMGAGSCRCARGAGRDRSRRAPPNRGR